MNPAFEIGRQAYGNVSDAFREGRDINAIEKILSQSMQSGNPEDVQNSISKILSQVSPQRQGLAMQYLQSAYGNIKEKNKLAKEETIGRAAAKEAGYTFGVSPNVAAEQVKNTGKSNRLAQYGLTQGPTQVSPTGAMPPTNVQPQQYESPFDKLSNAQLRVLAGAPDKEISEPAKITLQQRDEEAKREQSQKTELFKSDLARSNKIIEEADKVALQIPKKRSALTLMKDAIASKDLSFFTGDNLAEISGIEGFRSPEGAIFKSAGKEYLLGNISRAGARPNQWIEQQIADMMAKIGRTTEANLSVVRAAENELDLDEERLRLTQEISDRLREEGDVAGTNLPRELNKRMSQYAEEKQDVLFNDLRAIKAIADGKTQLFKKVKQGTKVSEYVVQALLNQFDNDKKKAREEAKKIGYE